MPEYQNKYFNTADGLSLHYRDYDKAGDGAPMVLCMPGLTRNSRDFEELAGALAPEFRVICMEFRGRGDSDHDSDPANYTPTTYASDMIALLEQEKPARCFALGTSLGGIVAMLVQATAPGTFSGIVLNDIGPEVAADGLQRIQGYVGKGAPATWPEAIAAVRHANTSVYPGFTDDQWDAFARKLYVERDGVPVAAYDPAIAENLNTDDKSRTTTPDLWDLFEGLSDTPIHVLRGELSDILTRSVLDRMVAMHPGLTVMTVSGVGHVPLMDTPDQQDSIAGFFRSQMQDN